MNKIIQLGLKPADSILVPKSVWNLIQHYAIYLGQDQYGTDWIIENKIGFGVKCITADEFFSGVPYVIKIKRFRGNDFERKLAVQRALRNAGRSYDLINYNCEHFANEVQGGIPSSNQVVFSFACVVAAVLLVASAGH